MYIKYVSIHVQSINVTSRGFWWCDGSPPIIITNDFGTNQKHGFYHYDKSPRLQYYKSLEASVGMDEILARGKTTQETLWVVKRVFFDNYKDLLLSYLHLKGNNTHQEIVDDLE